MEVIIGIVLLIRVFHGHDRRWLRMLLQVLDVVRGVPSFHGCQVVRALVLALPQ